MEYITLRGATKLSCSRVGLDPVGPEFMAPPARYRPTEGLRRSA